MGHALITTIFCGFLTIPLLMARERANKPAGEGRAPVRAAEKQARSSPERPLTVSLIQLIARPDDFDGEYVCVFGFYRTEHEGTAIYLHREDYTQGLSCNGLWVTRDAEEHNMKYVLLQGRFNAKNHGHLGLWSGEIDQVNRMIPWPPAPAGK